MKDYCSSVMGSGGDGIDNEVDEDDEEDEEEGADDGDGDDERSDDSSKHTIEGDVALYEW